MRVPPVLNWEAVGDDPTARNMAEMLKLLRKEEEERKKQEEIVKEKEKADKEEVERRDKEEEDRRLKDEEEKKLQEEEDKRKREDAEKDGSLDKVLEWIAKQKASKEAEDAQAEKVKQLQRQIELMTKKDNRQQCHMTGVNLFANMETIQGEGAAGVDLAAKAQAAMVAANNAKRQREEGDSDGESIHSHMSHGRPPKKKSGIAIRSGQKGYL